VISAARSKRATHFLEQKVPAELLKPEVLKALN